MRETLKSNQDLRGQPEAGFDTTDPRAAYKHFLPRINALSLEAIKPCTVDVALARRNIEVGLVAVTSYLDLARARLPRLSVPLLFELRPLGLALSFAADRVAATAEGALEGHLERVRFLRNLTLRQLEIFAYLDLVPEARVEAVRLGATPIDTCREALSIVALFAEYAPAIGGRHPFTDAQLNQLWERAQWLLRALRSRSAGTAWGEPATTIRDRFWTLVVEVHDELREAGVAIFGLKRLDEHVPPLGHPGAKPAKAATG